MWTPVHMQVVKKACLSWSTWILSPHITYCKKETPYLLAGIKRRAMVEIHISQQRQNSRTSTSSKRENSIYHQRHKKKKELHTTREKEDWRKKMAGYIMVQAGLCLLAFVFSTVSAESSRYGIPDSCTCGFDRLPRGKHCRAITDNECYPDHSRDLGITAECLPDIEDKWAKLLFLSVCVAIYQINADHVLHAKVYLTSPELLKNCHNMHPI